ncbi:hypothetical protein F444_02333 [Phytophthora nicotianae P1976]|uniref:DUF4371 domain-containing protein n=1 Tax=Phytophthora nicotianae P1976 TaxID=1317066 RepID=A0A081AXT3_PHYNI|nr:hypothetical protein F444_02333 [Phytophthora nicotianae P1976]
MMDSFLGGTRSCHLEIPNGIVELIRELYFNGDGVVADVVLSAGNILGVDNIRGAENALSVDTVLQDDFIAGVEADEFVEETDSKHLLVIPDRLQFETVIKCSNAMVSFRSITRVFGVFGEALKNSRLGRPTEYIVGRYIRSLVAINLTALRIILSNVWGFSLLVDGATHGSEGYFDVRVAFELSGTIFDQHLLAIPMGNLSHKAVNYAERVLVVLSKLGDDNLLRKLIGITSDGAATMLGCHGGFAKLIEQACGDLGEGGVSVNWCGSHQLNLAVGVFIDALIDLVNFRSILGAEITFTRKFESVRSSIGICPTYANTRWESISECCDFLSSNYEEIMQLHKTKGVTAPSSSWWLILFAIGELVEKIKQCFRSMQYRTVTMKDQYEALEYLVKYFQMKFEEQLEGEEASVSIFKVAKHIGNAALYSSALYNEKIDEIEQHRLENGLSNAITGFITGINEIKIEVKGAITATTSTTPIDIIAMEDMTEFRQLILPYRNRLRRQYGSGVISCIWKQVRKLRETYEFDSTFKDIVDRSCNRDIVQAWKLVDAKGEYTRLVSFALGLVSISPGTHTVEGDFSSLKGVKSAHRGSLSNYALEGQLQAKQYFELISLANSVGARSPIEK